MANRRARSGKKKNGEMVEGAGEGLSAGNSVPSVALAAVFSFLKGTRCVVSWKAEELQKILRVSAADARQILTVLEMQGYAQKESGGEEYLTTAAGESVCGSKKPTLDRTKVEEALSALTERIAILNKKSRSEFKVRKAVAFGDFLGDCAQVQAADVGVMLTSEGGSEDRSERAEGFLKELRAKSRFLQLQPFRKWMEERTHKRLV